MGVAHKSSHCYFPLNTRYVYGCIIICMTCKSHLHSHINFMAALKARMMPLYHVTSILLLTVSNIWYGFSFVKLACNLNCIAMKFSYSLCMNIKIHQYTIDIKSHCQTLNEWSLLELWWVSKESCVWLYNYVTSYK